MTPDTPPALVADVVAAGERLRMELLDALRGAGEDGREGLLSVKVLHECVCGLAIFHLWQLAETPLDARDEYARMTRHWNTIAGWVLTDNIVTALTPCHGHN